VQQLPLAFHYIFISLITVLLLAFGKMLPLVLEYLQQMLHRFKERD
jgi:hypothetical protein